LNNIISFYKKTMATPGFSGLVILIVMVIITANLQNNFFTMPAVTNNLNAFVPLILISMGQSLVMVSGGIDLSAGTALSLLTCVMARIMTADDPMSGVIAVLVAVAVSVGIGALNGLGMGYFRLPPVVVTFATSYIFLGAALAIMPRPGGGCAEWVKGFYSFSNIKDAPYWLVSFGKVMPPALILLIVACVAWLIIRNTRFARYAYAMGSNETCAFASGINTPMTMTKACIINAFFILGAALFFIAQNLSADARMGDPFALRSIAAAVVGGVALQGGRGSMFNAMIGAFTLSFVNKIIVFASLPTAYQTLVSGVIVIIAIAASSFYAVIGNRSMLKKGEASI